MNQAFEVLQGSLKQKQEVEDDPLAEKLSSKLQTIQLLAALILFTTFLWTKPNPYKLSDALFTKKMVTVSV